MFAMSFGGQRLWQQGKRKTAGLFSQSFYCCVAESRGLFEELDREGKVTRFFSRDLADDSFAMSMMRQSVVHSDRSRSGQSFFFFKEQKTPLGIIYLKKRKDKKRTNE